MNALDLDSLITLERQGWDALCTSQGGTFYGNLMTEDAVMVLVNGAVLGRDEIAGSLNQAPPWDSYEISEPRLVNAGTDSAILVYQARAQRGDDIFEALMSSVYVMQDRPRLALYQQTITH